MAKAFKKGPLIQMEPVEAIFGTLLIGGALYVVWREFKGGKAKEMYGPSDEPATNRGVYGTIPLPENPESSWLYVKNPEPRGTSTTNMYH